MSTRKLGVCVWKSLAVLQLSVLGNSLAVDLLVVSLLKSFKIKAGQYPVVLKSHFLSLHLEENIMDPILPSVLVPEIPSVIRVTWPQTKTSCLGEHVLEREMENSLSKKGTEQDSSLQP